MDAVRAGDVKLLLITSRYGVKDINACNHCLSLSPAAGFSDHSDRFQDRRQRGESIRLKTDARNVAVLGRCHIKTNWRGDRRNVHSDKSCASGELDQLLVWCGRALELLRD